ncbi:MAG: hypothetical protein UR69_C0001G0036 [Candidatus Moranbacteria bacterium GW2011_GWE2_35_2-]|nr:MAG: hypothetical protein UR69_C0001G0036 [Candidatus Moranbacteria bacterium GW2011_GWE2_35_2-]KKQ22966.1 MAG: hypothetical protein US37_C0001G0238 [Candidatus Moranbacteria bacterium GW2011_GWF2_37_11]KKQ29324.1 MAG: hypothetical protein US44_C0002G0106 [Candidatus Moranbacteria bacterium GW2011_GWD1_37_17]KKQ30803.1 MAG: hypothetical protein US47_C0001G0036 [Candidatus Moranbacteria bacterium GW2011_GWE1_37_24]KKQ47994.1 MAG: hypothetical protein US66_C0003G0048 [Candidatus Moranbacteria 
MSISKKLNGIRDGIYPGNASVKVVVSGFIRRTFVVGELLVVGNHLRTETVEFSTEISRITGIEISGYDADF